MALATNALTKVATVRAEVGDDVPSSVLQRLINVASSQIENYCKRSFYKESDKVEDVGGYGTNLLLVSKTPLLSIASISFDGDTIDSDEYEIHDAAAGEIWRSGGWVWTTPFRAGIVNTPIPGYERKLYQITYDGGFVTPPQSGTTTLPPDLEDACIRLVASRVNQVGVDVAVKSEKLLSWAATYDRSSEMPPAIAAMLDPYKRVVNG